MNNSSSSFLNLQWSSQTRSLLVLLLTTIDPTLSLLLLVLSVMFVFFIRYSLGYKVVQPRAPLPPGPVPWPILGNIPELLLRDKPAYKWIENIMNQMNTDIACIRLGATHVVPVRCPVIAREFLKKHDAVFASRPITMGTEYVSRGFLTVVLVPWGDQWKKMRRVVASEVLSPARLQWLLGKRTEEADNLVRYVYNQCVQGDGVVNVRLATRAYSGNVMRRMMFNRRYFGKGRSDGGPGVEEEEHVEAIFTVLSLLYAFSAGDYMPFLRRLDLDGHRKKLTAAAKTLNRYQDEIIDEKMKEWRDGQNEFRVTISKEAEDLVDVLILLKDDKGSPLLSADEIKAQTTELMIASVDNPSNAVEWALAEMINQPDIIRKCVEEIEMAVGKDRLVLESDFSKLPYVTACAREAFRLHPMDPFNVPHVSNADATVAGYFIPKGSCVLLGRAGLGQNPKVWDEPLKFKPERHLKNESSHVELTESELRFISFSTGRRGCVGVHLGSKMTIMLLARLLQGFEWTAPPGESRIDLSQSEHNMFLAKPLHALAKPRLPRC